MASFTSVMMSIALASCSYTIVLMMEISRRLSTKNRTGRSFLVHEPCANRRVQPRSMACRMSCSISSYASEMMNAARWLLPPSTTTSTT